jgi:hypothetical protein
MFNCFTFYSANTSKKTYMDLNKTRQMDNHSQHHSFSGAYTGNLLRIFGTKYLVLCP